MKRSLNRHSYRKSLQLFFFCFLTAIILFTGHIPVANALATESVMDGANLLQQQEIQQLTEKIQDVEHRHQVRIGIQTQKSLPGMSVGKAANNVLAHSYSDGRHGGIVLLLVMGTHDWYVSTDNEMRVRITDDTGFPYLTDQFLPDLSDGNYLQAFNTYVDTVDTMLTYYEKNGEAYDPTNEFDPLAMLIALAAAILIGWIVRAGLISTMSNVMHEPAADAYLVKDSVEITEQSDTYLYTTVTRVPKSKSSDSDSSSGSSSNDNDSDYGGGGGKF